MGRLSKVSGTEELNDDVHVFGPKCWYAELVPLLSKEDKKELDEQLNSSITATLLSRRLRAAYPDELRQIKRNGKSYSINRHRRGECSCGSISG